MGTLAQRPSPSLAFASALALSLVAGCIGAQDGTEDVGAGSTELFVPDFDFATAIEEGHDHADAGVHDGSYGLELVGFADLNEGPVVPGGYVEFAMAGPWAFVSNWGPDRGFTIVDVTDPANPTKVSDFFPSQAAGLAPIGTGSYWDVSAFPDGNLVVLSAQALANAPAPGHEEESGGGLFLVNTEDKANPVLESFAPIVSTDALIPVGIHNANPFEADGVWYVAATTANGETHIMQLSGEAPHRTLEEVSVVAGIHDSAVQVHPITGQRLLYTAGGGVFIWDMTDPAAPEMVSFTENGPDLSSYHETIPMNVLIDGRHYTVAAVESLGPPTPFTILDTTDPTAPVPVGQFRIPFEPTEPVLTPYMYSGHNVDFDRGRLYIGHYHAGVWIVDISSAERAAAPLPVAYYLPHEDAVHVPRTAMLTPIPLVWRAIYHDDGLVWAIDANTGIYALRPTIPPSPWEDATVFPHNVR